MHNEMYIHLYRNVHDKNPYTMTWIVIRTEMCTTINPYTKKWTVICTEMCMTKTQRKIICIVIRSEMFMTKTDMNIDSHLYRNMHEENT